MTTNTFIAGKGFLYRYDPRAKLLLLVLLCVLVFLPISRIGLVVLLLSVFFVTWRSVGFRQALQPVKTILPLLVIMILFVPLTCRDGEVVLQVGGFPLATREALVQLIKLVTRFTTITYLCTLFFWTTPMGDITLALRWYGLSYQAALVLTLSFRFIPFIAEAFQMIQDSHSLRNANLGERERKRRPISDIIPTVTSALVFSLKSIPQLAMSLEHRGLGRANRRTGYRSLSRTRGLFTTFLFSIMIPACFWLMFNTVR